MNDIFEHSRLLAQEKAGAADDFLGGILSAFDRVGIGALALDRSGFLIARNLAAQQHVGTLIKFNRRRIFLSDPVLNVKLSTVLDASSPAPAAIIALNQAKGITLLRLMPVGQAAPERILLLVSDPDQMRLPDASLIKAAFGLTKTELRISELLLRGLSLQDIAAFQDVGVATIRVQMKSIFAKTGASRQSQLLALLVRLAHLPRQVPLTELLYLRKKKQNNLRFTPNGRRVKTS